MGRPSEPNAPSAPRLPWTGISRRAFVRRAGAVVVGGLLGERVARRLPFDGPAEARGASEAERLRVYLAPDDHTDYLWSTDEDGYRDAFLQMLDFYLERIDATADQPPDVQARWNCDGSLWLWTYERHRPPEAFARLIERVRDGHVSVPLNPLVICAGGMPAEAVLRGMYYAGRIERRHGLRLPLAIAMENQTLPFGLPSLWAGSGARWSWKGICRCATRIRDDGDRPHELYWWAGPDGQRVLMKWYSLMGDGQGPGGYAEARHPADAVEAVTVLAGQNGFRARHPYDTIGLFGQGWDDLATTDDALIEAARTLSDESRRVIVSNCTDFFADVEASYGAELPTWSGALGNEWDVLSASLAETSARVRRATEALRAAEALAAIAHLADAGFMAGREAARDQAFMNLGLYFEHDWTADGPVPRGVRRDWQERLATEIESYVKPLARDGAARLGALVARPGGPPTDDVVRFYAFNPLGWARTDAVDLPWSALGWPEPPAQAAEGSPPLSVVDVATGREVPAQIVRRLGATWLQVLASDVPALGYRVFEVRPTAGVEHFAPAGAVTGGTIVSDAFQIEVAPRGALTSVLDRGAGNRELVGLRDGRAWNELGPGPLDEGATLVIESGGPVSTTVRATATAPLARETRVTVYRGIARIAIENRITQNFAATHTWDFELAASAPRVWHEEVGAVIRAALQADGGHYAARGARYDWLTLGHFVAAESGGRSTVLSSADCAFFRLGNSTADRLDTTTPRLAILAGGQVDGPDLGIPDQGGATSFLQRFAITTHAAFDPARAMRAALEHQNPLVPGRVDGGIGSLPPDRWSLLRLDVEDVLPWAVKPSEDGRPDTLALRLWNLAGRPTDARVVFGAPLNVASALRTTHIETPIGTAPVDGGALTASLAPHGLGTFAVTLARPPAVGAKLYMPVAEVSPREP